jgi:hypothetical protein
MLLLKFFNFTSPILGGKINITQMTLHTHRLAYEAEILFCILIMEYHFVYLLVRLLNYRMMFRIKGSLCFLFPILFQIFILGMMCFSYFTATLR